MLRTENIANDNGLGTEERFNIASYLSIMAHRLVDRPAVVMQRTVPGRARPRYDSRSFAHLDARSNQNARALSSIGIGVGCRALLLVRPCFDFVALMFALFKIGAVPVLIDPGMGLRRMLQCLAQVDVEALIGVSRAALLPFLDRSAFRRLRHRVIIGRGPKWGGIRLNDRSKDAAEPFGPADTKRTDPAAILFTSGSTGPAKGVVYEHGMFDAQIRAIREAYDMQEGEIDLPGFPPFALFSIAMGMTAVFPAMNYSRPARVNPARIVAAIKDCAVTTTFGSPAMWHRVADFCLARGKKLNGLRRVLIAGAPVSIRLIERLKLCLDPDADVHTPYGATESLPVTTISGREILEDCAPRTRLGFGTCVGRTLPVVEARCITVSDQPIREWRDELAVPTGTMGELAVRGPAVTRRYCNLPAADAAAKIPDGHTTWHRIGDVGYFDEAGRFWYCGRKSHRVVTQYGTMFTDPCESIMNEHQEVARSALVGVHRDGGAVPVMFVEPRSRRFLFGRRAARLRRELLAHAQSHDLTRAVADVFLRARLPVDCRHNAKINREWLAQSLQ